MPSTSDVNEAANEALHALLKRITEIAERTNDSHGIVRVALAYRYAIGGAQPGSVVVEK